MILTIIIFFTIIIGLGFSGIHLFKIKIDNNLEKYLIYISIGLGIFPMLTVSLNLLNIPLHWTTYILLAIIFPCIVFIKKIRKKKDKRELKKKLFRLTKTNAYVIAVTILSIILFSVYLKGAFSYDYLEDDDPWDHAVESKYIAIEKSYSRTIDPEHFKRTYIEPYPPSYDSLMGVLHQTNDSIYWTLKFFNALLIALGIPLFYIFAIKFMQNKTKALASAFIITILPSFMSHFIWAQTLAVILFFPAFYALLKIEEDKNWLWISIIIIGSILVSQPSSAAIFGIMLGLFWVCRIIIESFQKGKVCIWEDNKYFIIAGVGALFISMIYWIPTLIKFGLNITFQGIGLFTGLFSTQAKTIDVDTSGGLIYSIKDFFFAPLVSKMDQPIGWGPLIFIIVIFTVFMFLINYKKLKTNNYALITLIWFIFCLLGTEGNMLPIKLFPHRFWVFLAIPVALLCAEGLSIIYNSLKSRKQILYPIMVIIFIGLITTSAYPKYIVETSQWPPGQGWSSYEELSGYQWMAQNLPKNTPVFNICYDEEKVIGFDMYAPPLDIEIDTFRRGFENRSTEEIYTTLNKIIEKKKFEYMIIDITCSRSMGNKTNELLMKISNSGEFNIIHQIPNNFILFKKN